MPLNINPVRARTFAESGRTHDNKEEKEENVKGVHIRYKVIHHQKMRSIKQF
jgi:hypothetical protein